MFNPYDETDDYAGAKGCFKCGNIYADPVYLSFSSQPVGCRACAKDPNEEKRKADADAKFQKWVKEELPKIIAETKEKDRKYFENLKNGYRYSSKR